jgi:hypothetical protein
MRITAANLLCGKNGPFLVSRFGDEMMDGNGLLLSFGRLTNMGITPISSDDDLIGGSVGVVQPLSILHPSHELPQNGHISSCVPSLTIFFMDMRVAHEIKKCVCVCRERVLFDPVSSHRLNSDALLVPPSDRPQLSKVCHSQKDAELSYAFQVVYCC